MLKKTLKQGPDVPLFLTDVVLNHTAGDSEWVARHPECTVNTQNTPHLRAAYLLDCEIKKFQDLYIQGAQEIRRFCPHAPYLDCEEDLQRVLAYLRDQIYPKLSLHQYFLLDRDFSEAGQALSLYQDQEGFDALKGKV